MEQDRLSSLPVVILHDILSRLSRKCVARTSVLSKAWAEIWSTFPILSFSDVKFIAQSRYNSIEFEDYSQKKKKKFCDYVERTLLRFRSQDLAIKQFKLKVHNFQEMSKDIDIWLKFVCESNVEMLELHQYGCIREEVQDQCYILPASVLEAKSLTKLVLRGRIRVDLTCRNHPIKFFSLQVLTLDDVCFGEEEALKHLISCCPLIEYITLTSCCVYPSGDRHLHHARNSWMKSMSLCGLPRLKSVIVRGIQEVNVDSPCLENFNYVLGDLRSTWKVNFDRCRNLRWLVLECSKNTFITNKVFHELLLKFPFLETLRFGNCKMPERINISSDRLKKLALHYCRNSKEINIDTPNLSSFTYYGTGNHDAEPSISFLRYSSKLFFNVDMCVTYHSLRNFGNFIQKIKPQAALTIISFSIHDTIAVELVPIGLPISSTPPSIKHLVLRNIPNNEALHSPLVNRLLSNCCPTNISFLLDTLQRSRAFIELLYETLMGTKKDKFFHSSSGHSKRWWHNLKAVKVTSSMRIADNVDFKTILDAWQASAHQEMINFTLEF